MTLWVSRIGLWMAIGLAPVGMLAKPDGARRTLSLDGAWFFAADPGDAGERDRWFMPGQTWPTKLQPGDAPRKPGVIQVPGAWEAQGYGQETDKLRHQFNGIGWYRKDVAIPAQWKGSHLFLCVGGVMRRAKVWVDGIPAGEHVGYAAPFECEVTASAAPGRTAAIVMAVDSRWRQEQDDPLMGCGLFVDYMGSGYGKTAGYGSTSEATWGGIWGHVKLEARGAVWLEDLHVTPRVQPPSIQVEATLAGSAEQADSVRLEVCYGDKMALSRSFPMANVRTGPRLKLTPAQVGQIPEARLWSPWHPNLYQVRLILMRGKLALDQVQARVGLREIRTEGYHFLLNNRRIYLNGYGDDSVYPETIACPVNKAYYLERLRLIRSLGFNYVRHHSHAQPEEYYEACDEMGMLVQAEAPVAYGYRAKDETAAQTYLREWRGVILHLRNHPSLMTWCSANEAPDFEGWMKGFYDLAKELDPERFYIASDGIQHGGWPQLDPKYFPFTVVQFDVFRSLLDVPAKFKFDVTPKVPVVAHEEGNYITFPRYDQIASFKESAVKPFWLTGGRERIEKMGLLKEAPQWAENSEKLYYALHKMNLEALRKNERISGYHWWLLQDFWTTDNGLVNVFFQLKPGFTKGEVLKINSESVLLEDGLARSYVAGGRLKLRLLVSHYGEDGVGAGRACSWRVSWEEGLIAGKDLTAPAVGQGELRQLAEIEVTLPEAKHPRKVRIEAAWETGERTIHNDWTTWVFPAGDKAPALDVPLYADALGRALLEGWPAPAIPKTSPMPASALYVTSRPSSEILEAVRQGAALLMLHPENVLETDSIVYKLPWWRVAGGPEVSMGTMVYDHPLTRDLAPERWCEPVWYELIQQARGVFLDSLPTRPEALIRSIEAPIVAHDKALLFQVRLGRGMVTVSGLNFGKAGKMPIGRWLLARLIEQAALPAPQSMPEIPAAALQSKPVPKPDEGALAGYSRVLAPGDQSVPWHSYREDTITGFTCRQTQAGNRVEWLTAPVPAGWDKPQATFVWAGGLGYREEPDAGGFSLEVDGKPAIEFDLTREETSWKRPDGFVTLRFVPLRLLPSDALGFFYLTVNRNELVPGQPLRVAVTSKGSGSRRWFTLHSYKDLAEE